MKKNGSFYIWLTGCMMALSVLLVSGLIGLVMYYGFATFWQKDVALVQLKNNSYIIGEIKKKEINFNNDLTVQLKTGNRDFYGVDFRWIKDSEIQSINYDKEILHIERDEWGSFYGYPKSFEHKDKKITYNKNNKNEFYNLINSSLKDKNKITKKINVINKKIGEINFELSELEKEKRVLSRVNLNENKITKLDEKKLKLLNSYKIEERKLFENIEILNSTKLVVSDIEGATKLLTLVNIIRFNLPNELSFTSKISLYLSKIWEFLSDKPRESNTEGGVFPAIFGTILMVLIMSIAVLPLGVIAAVYLNEYAKQGKTVALIRICVNNLAGVPSIVFGVFGLGFFIYGIGGSIDTLFYQDNLPSPTYGTGGILWASLTLALLTVPVVIVATEESLNAVSKGIRDGSLALGATKWETLRNIIIPTSLPGILTGLILAISRATGEVAPLMITGVVKLAPSMPLDGYFPYLHLERKFMHLGFHIYDVGFQSPNSEAALPMVFSTALLLILIVIVLNSTAILIRNRLRLKHKG